MRINFHNMCNVAQNEFLNAYTYHASKRFVSNADCKERLFSFSVTHGVSCFGVIQCKSHPKALNFTSG